MCTNGRNSDWGIFSGSVLGKSLCDSKLNVPPPKPIIGAQNVLPHVIVEDAAFPLLPYLMRPYPYLLVVQHQKSVPLLAFPNEASC